RAALIALTAGLLLAGCSVPVGTAAPSPTPTDTVTPAPDPTSTQPPDYDARCDAGFGIPVAVPEEKHRIRPTGWPRPPPAAPLDPRRRADVGPVGGAAPARAAPGA